MNRQAMELNTGENHCAATENLKGVINLKAP
jgi:hypothetical protein